MNVISRRLSPERRARIVDAARHLILRQGLRATTMEAIAREARIAKPTLYGYFADKEAVFATIIQALVDDIRAAVDSALSGEGDVVARVGGALAAKYKVVAKLLDGSPHADELYSEHGRSAAAQFAAVEQQIEAAITGALQQAGVARPRPLAQLLLASAYGIGSKAATPAEIGPAIRLLVERLVRPELPGRG
jgi:AcrR family transcriptional regulator